MILRSLFGTYLFVMFPELLSEIFGLANSAVRMCINSRIVRTAVQDQIYIVFTVTGS